MAWNSKPGETIAIDNYEKFNDELMRLQKSYSNENRELHMEVSEDFFKVLAMGQKTNYITYGRPGVKVFREGTKEAMIAEDNLSAEEHKELVFKRRSKEHEAMKKKM